MVIVNIRDAECPSILLPFWNWLWVLDIHKSIENGSDPKIRGLQKVGFWQVTVGTARKIVNFRKKRGHLARTC